MAAKTKTRTAAKPKPKAKAKAKAKRNPSKRLQDRVGRIEQALTSGLGLNLTESDEAAIQGAAAPPEPEAVPLTYEERLCRVEIVLRRHGFYL